MAGKRATKAQTEKRVQMVYELLLSDSSRYHIIQFVIETWGVKTSSADKYIRKANDLISEEAARIREDALERHLAQRTFLRNKALRADDNRLAFDILRDESKLLDLYPAERKEVTGQGGEPVKVKVIKGVSMDDL